MLFELHLQLDVDSAEVAKRLFTIPKGVERQVAKPDHLESL